MSTIIQMMFLLSKKIKGFVRKITSTFPITCVDCVDEDSLINMSIEGNCYQDGEPTYDNPIEIQSVGEKTANMLVYPYSHTTKTDNGITFTDNGDGSITANGTATASTTFAIFSIEDIPDKTQKYYLSGCPSSGSYYRCIVVEYLYNNNWMGEQRDVGKGLLIDLSSLGYEVDKIKIYIRVANGNTADNLLFKPMLIEADTEVDGYEPYGYKVPIVVETENLFVKGIPTAGFWFSYVNGEGVRGFGSSVSTSTKVKELFKPNHTYTVSFDMECIAKGNIGTIASRTYGLSVYDSTNKRHIINGLYTGTEMSIGEKRHMTATSTIPSNYEGNTYNFYYYTGRYVDENGAVSDYGTIRFTNIKIEEADHETEPIVSNVYLKEPLRGINAYTDKLDVKKGECTRNIKTTQLDKNTGFLWRVLSSNTPMITYKLSDAYSPEIYSDIVISSHYLTNRHDAYYGRSNAVFLDTTKYLRIYHEGITTLDEYKELLGDEVIDVAYVLAEPITEKIIAPNIPTFKHGTTYSIATTVQPLSGTVEYYSTTKGE